LAAPKAGLFDRINRIYRMDWAFVLMFRTIQIHIKTTSIPSWRLGIEAEGGRLRRERKITIRITIRIMIGRGKREHLEIFLRE